MGRALGVGRQRLEVDAELRNEDAYYASRRCHTDNVADI